MSEKKGKIVLPKLFPRGKKGFYYFRRLVDGKDCWVNTKMVELEEAKKVATKHIRAELSVEAFSHLESSASKLADTYVESLTGKKNTRTPISAAHQIWIDHSKKYNDVIARTRKYYHTIFDRFAIWCKAEDIENVEEVDHSAATRYSKALWESGLGGKAFNDLDSLCEFLVAPDHRRTQAFDPAHRPGLCFYACHRVGGNRVADAFQFKRRFDVKSE